VLLNCALKQINIFFRKFLKNFVLSFNPVFCVGMLAFFLRAYRGNFLQTKKNCKKTLERMTVQVMQHLSGRCSSSVIVLRRLCVAILIILQLCLLLLNPSTVDCQIPRNLYISQELTEYQACPSTSNMFRIAPKRKLFNCI